MMSDDITQEVIDAGVSQAREQWQKMVEASGVNQTMFIATNKAASQFLGEYEMMRESLKEKGWELPDLVEGLKINFSDTTAN
jgi:hypothetical protein